jgi:hypothetical protein
MLDIDKLQSEGTKIGLATDSVLRNFITTLNDI